MKRVWRRFKKLRKLRWFAGLFVLYVVFLISYDLGQHNPQLTADGSSLVSSQTNPLLSRPPEVSDIDIYQLFQLTNHERAKAGLQQLSLNPKLNSSAAAKCNDMVKKDYWSHFDPAGNPPWHFMTAAGIPYIHMGENLGEGFRSADSQLNGWMKSAEHKANILDPRFTDIGFGVCKSKSSSKKLSPGVLVVVQHFAEL